MNMRKHPTNPLIAIATAIIATAMAASCARMGHPDGGWYDETPPTVVATSPAYGATGVKAHKVEIEFDEFVKIDNATENVIVSPPQMETPEIKSAGKKIKVELKDTLKENTTYTIDFSDAITDNNEGNPLGNYTYTFSTGEQIDTFQVAGNVLEAENLEPVKGMLVGLYTEREDSAFLKLPMLRVARTDSRGHFVIQGVAPGSYRIYALQDADGNYRFSQKSEKIAFSNDSIVPSSRPDVRQDTLWTDSLHIKDIARVNYIRFTPDDIVLRAFTETLTDRYFIKSERKDADHFTLFFSYGSETLPEVRGLNFDATDAFILEPTTKNDTLTYWLRDTALVNQDTLDIELSYLATDTLGVLQQRTDTLQLLSKQTYEKRMKEAKKQLDEWQKKQEKKKKKGEPYDSIMPPEELAYKLDAPSSLDPDRNLTLEFNTPLSTIDTTRIHLYAKHDTLWYNAPFEIEQISPYAKADSAYATAKSTAQRRFVLRGEWRPGIEYSFELDSAAFVDIYGKASMKQKKGFKVRSLDDYGTLVLNIAGMDSQPMIVQLLNNSGAVAKQVNAEHGTAQFFYITPGKYYVRLIVDSNGNGVWDTGDFMAGRQPEEVYYCREAIECRAKWDITQTWSPKSVVLTQQKPSAITKQKADKKKTVVQRNAERARKLGIQYVP